MTARADDCSNQMTLRARRQPQQQNDSKGSQMAMATKWPWQPNDHSNQITTGTKWPWQRCSRKIKYPSIQWRQSKKWLQQSASNTTHRPQSKDTMTTAKEAMAAAREAAIAARSNHKIQPKQANKASKQSTNHK